MRGDGFFQDLPVKRKLIAISLATSLLGLVRLLLAGLEFLIPHGQLGGPAQLGSRGGGCRDGGRGHGSA